MFPGGRPISKNLQIDFQDSYLLSVDIGERRSARAGQASFVFDLNGDVSAARRVQVDISDLRIGHFDIRQLAIRLLAGATRCNWFVSEYDQDRDEVTLRLRLASAHQYCFYCTDVSEIEIVEKTDTPRIEIQYRLTSAHSCVQCREDLLDENSHPLATGQQTTTVHCLNCENTTSVYAILHRCASCGVKLESPSNRATQAYDCPACGAQRETPGDLLVAQSAHAVEADTHFQVTCPSCDLNWASRLSDVRKLSVCPACEFPFAIPRGGEAITRTPHGHNDPTIRCSACQQLVPTAVENCPICGHSLPR